MYSDQIYQTTLISDVAAKMTSEINLSGELLATCLLVV